MSQLIPTFRCATSDDAAQMAELVNISGDGLPLYLWAKFARPGQSAWEVGLERARLGLGGFAFQNPVVLEVKGEVAACLIGYPCGDAPQAPAGDVPAALVPLNELGNLARNTWSINILATFPQHRGKGFGSELLRVAEMRARAAQVGRMSLIVSDANVVAGRLYAKNGFAECATRPIVKEEWEHEGQNWVLLIKNLSMVPA
ncbi:MAG: GNAT family N-acetyltransferase [Burkholderiales bacterium]